MLCTILYKLNCIAVHFMLMGQCINLTTIGVFQYISPLTKHADDNFVVLQ